MTRAAGSASSSASARRWRRRSRPCACSSPRTRKIAAYSPRRRASANSAPPICTPACRCRATGRAARTGGGHDHRVAGPGRACEAVAQPPARGGGGVPVAALRRRPHREEPAGAEQPAEDLRGAPRGALPARGRRPAGQPGARARRPDPRAPRPGAPAAAAGEEDHRRLLERRAGPGRARSATREEGSRPVSARRRSKPSEDAPREVIVLRLYIAGTSERSARAIRNAKQLCEQHLEGRYELEVIDIFQQTDRAREDQIVAVPTLIKRLPLPLKRFIGDLSDRDVVLVDRKSVV